MVGEVIGALRWRQDQPAVQSIGMVLIGKSGESLGGDLLPESGFLPLPLRYLCRLTGLNPQGRADRRLNRLQQRRWRY